MWRTLLSLVLTFVAIAWAGMAAMLIYLFGVGLWEPLFGPSGGAVAAGGVFVLALLVARWLTHLADRLLGVEAGGADGFAGAMATDAPRDRPTADWRDERAALFHNKRWAYFRRTRQFKRLAELDASEGKQARNA